MKIGKVKHLTTSNHWTPEMGRESMHITFYVQRLERERDALKRRVETLERELEDARTAPRT